MIKRRYIFVLALVLALVSCRSAQQLVDKAIKKDPTIVMGTSDTLTLSHFIIDSILVVKNDTIVWERVSVEVKFDTIIRNNSIFIERKKTRFELRKESQLQKKVLNYEFRIKRLQEKLASKTDRVVVRNETKQERSKNRWWFWFGLGAATVIVLRLLLNKRINFKF